MHRFNLMLAVLITVVPLHAMQKEGRLKKEPHELIAEIPYEGVAKSAKNKELLAQLSEGLWGIFIGSAHVKGHDQYDIVQADTFYQNGIDCLTTIQPMLDRQQTKFDNHQLGHSVEFVHSCLKSLVIHGEHQLLASLISVLPHNIAHVYTSSKLNVKHTLLDVAELQLQHLSEAGVSLNNAQKVKSMIIDEGGQYLMADPKRAPSIAELRPQIIRRRSKVKRTKITISSSSDDATDMIHTVERSNANSHHSELHDPNFDERLYPNFDFLNVAHDSKRTEGNNNQAYNGYQEDAPFYQRLDSYQPESAYESQKISPEEKTADAGDTGGDAKQYFGAVQPAPLEPLFEGRSLPVFNLNEDNE